MNENFKYSELTERIIRAFYTVYDTLGYGFLEKVYENAMILELENMGFTVTCQRPISVTYKRVQVGRFYADLLVDDLIILELKATGTLCE